jgi:hypothetical protein
MAGSITLIQLSDGSRRYRARYRDRSGRQHEERYVRKVDAQRWLDEATAALVTQTWTAPERGRVTVVSWAEQWLAAQTGIKPNTPYRYESLLRTHVLPTWGGTDSRTSRTPTSQPGWRNYGQADPRRAQCDRPTGSSPCFWTLLSGTGASPATLPTGSPCHG